MSDADQWVNSFLCISFISLNVNFCYNLYKYIRPFFLRQSRLLYYKFVVSTEALLFYCREVISFTCLDICEIVSNSSQLSTLATFFKMPPDCLFFGIYNKCVPIYALQKKTRERNYKNFFWGFTFLKVKFAVEVITVIIVVAVVRVINSIGLVWLPFV